MDRYLCSVCKKSVLNQHKAICCFLTFLINGFTSNEITWITSITTDVLVNLMNQLNSFTVDEKENELHFPNCKYRDPDYFKNLYQRF